MSSNILTYSIATETLSGTIGADRLFVRAWSGGRRGAKSPGAESDVASYNVFRKEQHDKGIHGGPIPPGFYLCRYVAHHPKFHECIFLEQTLTSLFQVNEDAKVSFYNRDGFYIHGRGPHGSDGCIVPENESVRKHLNKLVKNCPGTVMLRVADRGFPLPAAISRGSWSA
jgi:hypothetical protein